MKKKYSVCGMFNFSISVAPSTIYEKVKKCVFPLIILIQAFFQKVFNFFSSTFDCSNGGKAEGNNPCFCWLGAQWLESLLEVKQFHFNISISEYFNQFYNYVTI
jgi:hypothetical protein